jgi:signal transduction histidine kinase
MLNLILNSKDAMSATDWPVRVLVTRSQESNLAKWSFQCRIPVTVSARLTVSAIFEPYFSTKTSGLGLWIGLIIVESHGGRIWATQDTSRGATFQFTLPTTIAL